MILSVKSKIDSQINDLRLERKTANRTTSDYVEFDESLQWFPGEEVSWEVWPLVRLVGWSEPNKGSRGDTKTVQRFNWRVWTTSQRG